MNVYRPIIRLTQNHNEYIYEQFMYFQKLNHVKTPSE